MNLNTFWSWSISWILWYIMMRFRSRRLRILECWREIMRIVNLGGWQLMNLCFWKSYGKNWGISNTSIRSFPTRTWTRSLIMLIFSWSWSTPLFTFLYPLVQLCVIYCFSFWSNSGSRILSTWTTILGSMASTRWWYSTWSTSWPPLHPTIFCSSRVLMNLQRPQFLLYIWESFIGYWLYHQLMLYWT